jgi:hypothetical protein
MFPRMLQKTSKTKARVRTEWGSYDDCELAFGFSRSFTYQLWQAGKIRSVALKGRGQGERGKRLFSFASIRQLIAAEEEAASTK